MNSGRRFSLWTIGIVSVLVIFAVITLPNFRRSPTGVEQRSDSATTSVATQKSQMSAFLAAPASQKLRSPQGVVGGLVGGRANQVIDKKVIRNAELALIVQNVDEASAKIRSFTLQQKGEIDQVREWAPSEHTREGELHLRVPADDLEVALKQFKSVALHVRNEQLTATDVTRQFADNAARMRSLQAEEQQYLQILKQAKSVQDVLDVTEKLNEVRSAIEQLQTDINVMSHDIAMSAISISLTQNAPEGTALSGWHPLINARRSLRSMVEGLGDWVDSIVSIVIYLPVIALWLLTIGGIALILWRIGQFFWKRRGITH